MKYYKITGDVGVPEKTFTLYESFNPTFDMDDVSYALACDQMKSWARDNNLSPTLEPHYSWVEITEEEYDLNTTRYIRFYGDAGYCGTEFEEYHLLRDVTNDDELNDMAYGYALDNAADYNWCVEDMGIDLDDDDEYEAAIEDAQNNLSYGWEEVTKEEYEAEAFIEMVYSFCGAHKPATEKDEQKHEYHVVVTEGGEKVEDE